MELQYHGGILVKHWKSYSSLWWWFHFTLFSLISLNQYKTQKYCPNSWKSAFHLCGTYYTYCIIAHLWIMRVISALGLEVFHHKFSLQPLHIWLTVRCVRVSDESMISGNFLDFLFANLFLYHSVSYNEEEINKYKLSRCLLTKASSNVQKAVNGEKCVWYVLIQ